MIPNGANHRRANDAAAKAGDHRADQDRREGLGRFGVTVNAVLPFADTGMTAAIPEDKKAPRRDRPVGAGRCRV